MRYICRSFSNLLRFIYFYPFCFGFVCVSVCTAMVYSQLDGMVWIFILVLCDFGLFVTRARLYRVLYAAFCYVLSATITHKYMYTHNIRLVIVFSFCCWPRFLLHFFVPVVSNVCVCVCVREQVGETANILCAIAVGGFLNTFVFSESLFLYLSLSLFYHCLHFVVTLVHSFVGSLIFCCCLLWRQIKHKSPYIYHVIHYRIRSHAVFLCLNL